jgi:hypothetical protein
LSLDNGEQIAQTLQALGGTGSVIDLTSMPVLDTNSVSIIQKYIDSSGKTTSPTQLTSITTSAAVLTAMESLETLPARTMTAKISDVLTGALIVHQNTLKATWAVAPWTGQVISLPVKGVTYLKPNGDTYKICINTLWADPVHQPGNGMGSICSSNGVSKEGTWHIPSGSTNSVEFKLDGADNAAFLNTVTFKDLNEKSGLFTNVEPNAYGNPQYIASFTGSGNYIFLNTSARRSFLAGKTMYSSGNESCTDGDIKFVYSADGSTFEKSCVKGQPNPVNGTLEDVAEMPGLFKLTISGKVFYSGITVDSTPTTGRSVIFSTGTSNCGTGDNPYKISDCGGLTIKSYSR